MCFRRVTNILIAFFSFLWIGNGISGHKILGLFPYAGKSHFVMSEAIMKELALRGHTVHVVSHSPLATPLENYTDFSIQKFPLSTKETFEIKRFKNSGFYLTCMKELFTLQNFVEQHKNILKTTAMQNLLNSKENYDLIITETFILDMTLGFVEKFKAPFIFLRTSSLLLWTSQFVANPSNPSYIKTILLTPNAERTFFGRLRNVMEFMFEMLYWRLFILPLNNRIMRESFGSEMPSVLDIGRNVSLILTNTHHTVTDVKPLVPAIVDVGGVHIPSSKKLPEEIEEFIENSPHGVIYFCMGSMLKGASWPEEKKNAFLNAFSQLKERVLWKFENQNATDSKKIMVKKWMPQRDILAHPRVKLFISHGGLHGVLEAVSSGKPILGIPMFADQFINIRSLEAKGMAKFLEYASINDQTILAYLKEVLKPLYAEKAEQLSKEFNDRPMSPMDTAIFWIEYVIRNKGAKHLRSAAIDMPFYQYLLLDIIAFILVTIMLLILSIRKCFRVFKEVLEKNGRNKQKIN